MGKLGEVFRGKWTITELFWYSHVLVGGDRLNHKEQATKDEVKKNQNAKISIGLEELDNARRKTDPRPYMESRYVAASETAEASVPGCGSEYLWFVMTGVQRPRRQERLPGADEGQRGRGLITGNENPHKPPRYLTLVPENRRALVAPSTTVKRGDEVNMEQRRNSKAGETGDPRETPHTISDIVRHGSHMLKYGKDASRRESEKERRESIGSWHGGRTVAQLPCCVRKGLRAHYYRPDYLAPPRHFMPDPASSRDPGCCAGRLMELPRRWLAPGPPPVRATVAQLPEPVRDNDNALPQSAGASPVGGRELLGSNPPASEKLEVTVKIVIYYSPQTVKIVRRDSRRVPKDIRRVWRGIVYRRHNISAHTANSSRGSQQNAVTGKQNGVAGEQRVDNANRQSIAKLGILRSMLQPIGHEVLSSRASSSQSEDGRGSVAALKYCIVLNLLAYSSLHFWKSIDIDIGVKWLLITKSWAAMRVKRNECEAVPEFKEWRKRDIPEKTRRPEVSPGTISSCENPVVTPPGIEPSSPWWEVGSLTTTPPRHQTLPVEKLASGTLCLPGVLCSCRRALASLSHAAKRRGDDQTAGSPWRHVMNERKAQVAPGHERWVGGGGGGGAKNNKITPPTQNRHQHSTGTNTTDTNTTPTPTQHRHQRNTGTNTTQAPTQHRHLEKHISPPSPFREDVRVGRGVQAKELPVFDFRRHHAWRVLSLADILRQASYSRFCSCLISTDFIHMVTETFQSLSSTSLLLVREGGRP
ncbi:hypothetical protein PR048_001175 [Dryococelus australis]|uniref:Uncharacterized protein n=1 Tax=Dryococelus australis TaxID=614101 RepID=A0ABQ9IHL2_9NEOP|nr:hypothetical protein PR048_001175 [Dryococelus australis]